MAKKQQKGKQKDQTSAEAATIPISASQHPPSSPPPKQILSRLDTGNLGFAGATSPQHTHQEFASTSHAADTWGTGAGAWETHDSEGGHDDAWGPVDDGPWATGMGTRSGTGTGTHASPATGPMPGLWGQDTATAASPPAQNSWLPNPSSLSAAITNAMGFGAQPAANAGAAPPVQKKSTLKKSPPGADKAYLSHVAAAPVAASPASKHVAFGPTSLYSPATSASAPQKTSSTTARAMHQRSQSYGGHGAGAAEAPEPLFERYQNAYPAASAPPTSMPAGAAAWTNWAKEAQSIGRPRVATTIAASVPTSSAPAATQAAASAAGNRAAALAQQNAALQSLLSHPGQPKAQAQPMHRRQASEPAYGATSAHTQQWGQSWGQTGQPATTHHSHKHGKSHRPQQMQHADSWGNEWQDNTNDNAGAWGAQDNKTTYGDTWGAQSNGDWPPTDTWDTGAGGGGGWGGAGGAGGAGGWGGAGAGAGGWGGAGAGGGWEESAGGEKSGRGRSSRKKERGDSGGYGQWKGGGYGYGTIHEEDEEEYEDDEEEEDPYYDDLEDMYLDPEDHSHDKHKVRQGVSYQYQPPTNQASSAPPGLGFGRTQQPSALSPISYLDAKPQGSPMLPSPEYSKTMNIATGRSTTVFELAPPRRGNAENSILSSDGAALESARRAFYSTQRLAKDRIFWAFNPDKDPRVSSLMRWIQAMSSGLAAHGLQKFLETGKRGALIANADYRSSSGPGSLTQPTFDWVTLDSLWPTFDRILQESVVCYRPSSQVIVIVFLLSKTGNSMAMWRRKLVIPESLRVANKDGINHVLDLLADEKKIVYVDEMPPPKGPPPPPPKKKRGFWRRLFGLKAKEKK